MAIDITTAAANILQSRHSLLQTTTKMTQTDPTVTFSSNETKNCLEQDELQSSLAVLYAVIFVPGLIGNLVALWVFLFVNSKKNSVRVFLINIAFADLLLMVCVPFRVLYHSQGNRWSLDPTVCIIVGTLFYMNMYISITLLGMISVDRYLKIHRGAGINRNLSIRWSYAICAFTWMVAVGLMLPLLILRDPSQSDKCFHYRQLLEAKWHAYINIVVLVLFWLVCIALMVSYVKIALKLQRTSKKKPDFPNASHYTCAAKKSFFIPFLFTVCFVPYHLVRIFYIKTQITDVSCFWRGVADKANEIALVLSAFNSCLDPVMYFLLSSSVRKEVVRVVASVFCLKDITASHGSSSTVEPDRIARSDKGEINISLVNTSSHKN